MKVTVRITKNFKREAKPLLKKFNSLTNDLLQLENDLIKTPKIGIPLGHDCFKIRLKITSKGKGKSGGARVVTLVETEIIGIAEINLEEEVTVSLLTIFDKSDIDNLTDKELKKLISQCQE